MSISIFIKRVVQNIQSYLFYSENLDPLLILRGLACLIIIWDHVQGKYGWIVIRGFDLSFVVSFSGFMAVPIFYLISGYAVGYGFFSGKYSLKLKSLGTFYSNRFLRIAPAYYTCILLSIFIFYRNTAISPVDILRLFTFTANYNYINLPFQGILAIISTEMQFYLIAPVLFVVISHLLKKVHPILTGMFILLLGISVRYMLLTMGLVDTFNLYRLNVYVTVWGMIDYFLFGMFLSYLIIQKPTYIITAKKHIPAFVFPAVLICWFLWWNYTNYNGIFYSWSSDIVNRLFVQPLSLCVIIGWYILSVNTNYVYRQSIGGIKHLLTLLIHPRTFMYSVGFLSFGLYLYHYVVFDLLYLKQSGYDMNETSISKFIIILVFTGIAALLSHYLIENPFLRFRQKSK